MERFILFGGNTFYPEGGWKDAQGSFESVSAAYYFMAHRALTSDLEWWHIYDTTLDRIVAEKE